MIIVFKNNQPVLKILSLFFCYAYAEISKSLEFDIKAGQAVNISLDIPNITGINNFSNLVIKSLATWNNSLKIVPAFVRNYTQGETLPSYYLLTDSVDRATENFYNITSREVDNGRLLTSLIYTEGLLKWKRFIGFSIIDSSPSIANDGTIYVGSSDNSLYAINPDSSLKWKYFTGSYNSYSSPSIASDGTIYIGSSNHNLYAISPDGSLKWKYLTGNQVWSSPSISSGGTIYIGSYDCNLYAINPDGSLKWKYLTNGFIYSSPAIASNGVIYVGSDDCNLYAISPDGSLKWKYFTGSWMYSSPSIGIDGTIYVGCSNSNLYAINPDSSLKWKYLTGGTVFSSPSIATDGTIYVGSRDNNLYAINPNGSLKWRYLTEGWVDSSVSIGIDGTIYVGSSDHNLYSINPNGSLKWKYFIYGTSIIYSSPSIASDGTIYMSSSDNNLYAISSKNYFSTSPWSKFHQNHFNNGVQTSFKNSLQLFDFRLLTMNWFSHDTGKLLIDFEVFDNQVITMYIQMQAINKTSTQSATQKSTPIDTVSNDAIVIFHNPEQTSIIDLTKLFGRSDISDIVIRFPKSLTRYNMKLVPMKLGNHTYGQPLAPYVLASSSPSFIDLANSSTGLEYNSTYRQFWAAAGRMKWYFSNPESYFTDSVTVGANGSIYAAGDKLYCLNIDGTLGWSYNYTLWSGKFYSFRSPILRPDGGGIYMGGAVFGSDAYLFSLSLNGSLQWISRLDNTYVYSSPAIGADGSIYISTNYIYSVNPNGTLKWSYKQTTGWGSSPAIAIDGSVYIGAGNLYCFHANGTLKWIYPLGNNRNGIHSPVIGKNGNIYITSDNYLHCINSSGSLQWSFAVAAGVSSVDNPVVLGIDDSVYIGSESNYADSGGGKFYCINPNGSLKWSYYSGWVWSSAAIGVDGSIYVISTSLFSFNPNGTLQWSFPIYDYLHEPTIGADGSIYIVPTYSQTIISLSIKIFGQSPWPMSKQNLQRNGRIPDNVNYTHYDLRYWVLTGYAASVSDAWCLEVEDVSGIPANQKGIVKIVCINQVNSNTYTQSNTPSRTSSSTLTSTFTNTGTTKVTDSNTKTLTTTISATEANILTNTFTETITDTQSITASSTVSVTFADTVTAKVTQTNIATNTFTETITDTQSNTMRIASSKIFLSDSEKKSSNSDSEGLYLGVAATGGFVGGVAISAGLILYCYKKKHPKNTYQVSPNRFQEEGTIAETRSLAEMNLINSRLNIPESHLICGAPE